MGWIDRDKLRPEFAEPLNNVKTGDIVGPVETPEGFYFIRVSNIAPAEKIPFEEAARTIEKTLKEKAVNERKHSYIEKLKGGAVILMLTPR